MGNKTVVDKKFVLLLPREAKFKERAENEQPNTKKIGSATSRNCRRPSEYEFVSENRHHQHHIDKTASTGQKPETGSDEVQDQDDSDIVPDVRNVTEKLTLESYFTQSIVSKQLVIHNFRKYVDLQFAKWLLKHKLEESHHDGTCQYVQTSKGQQVDLKMEEINQEIKNEGTTNEVLFQSHDHPTRNEEHVYQIPLNSVGTLLCIIPFQEYAKHDICVVDDEEDQCVKLALPPCELLFKAEVVDPNCHSSSSGAEVVGEYLVVELNHQLNLNEGGTCGYMGDDENNILTKAAVGNGNGNQKKTYRKKLGVYPQYRIRLNGVPWRTIDSSDEHTDDESTVYQRGSRKSRYMNKNRTALKASTGTPNTYCEEGDEEESESNVTSSTKRKIFTKLKHYNYEETVTTTSEASDVESLTDCSLCFSDTS